MASTDFCYFAVYFMLLLSKVWVSRPTTFVTNSFLAGPAFLGGLWGNLGFPLILGLLSVILFLFPPLFSKEGVGCVNPFVLLDLYG
jgi:hypothetical protein